MAELSSNRTGENGLHIETEITKLQGLFFLIISYSFVTFSLPSPKKLFKLPIEYSTAKGVLAAGPILRVFKYMRNEEKVLPL